MRCADPTVLMTDSENTHGDSGTQNVGKGFKIEKIH